MPAPFLTAPRFPVPHGFSTRHGGCSEGPYGSLNLSFAVGDAPARVEENLGRLARTGGFSLPALSTASQVHGDRVLEAAGAGHAAGIAPPLGEADALWTARPGEAVGVRTADCVPVLLADPEGRRVAAIHSGWRGTDLRIAARAVEALVRAGARAGELLAAIGPSIRACCYAVSPDLGARFERGFGAGVAIRRGGEWRLELAIAVRDTLVAAGLSADRIDLLPQCTACDAEAFFSHRRDQGITGRHLSFAVRPPSQPRAFS